jgi:hypothetical protein
MPSTNSNSSFKATQSSANNNNTENSSTFTTTNDVAAVNQLNQNATDNLTKHDSLITTTKQQHSQASSLLSNLSSNDNIYNLPSFDALNVVASASASTVHSLTTSINVNIFIYLVFYHPFVVTVN